MGYLLMSLMFAFPCVYEYMPKYEICIFPQNAWILGGNLKIEIKKGREKQNTQQLNKKQPHT